MINVTNHFYHLFKGLHFKLKNVSLARLSTFPIFFGQLTGAYEGIGTVSLKVLLQSISFADI